MRVREKRITRNEEESVTDRQERIAGWRQDRINQARVLMLGAGALGNEAAKNLSLMGIGYMFIADMDVISRSNLSRAVFFRERDVQQQRRKAEVVAHRAQAMNVTPNAAVQTFHGDIVWQLGGGVFRRVDVVLGCLDNVEARMHANTCCLYTETPFLDGGILELAGSLTAVHPPVTACWECTTTKSERDNSRNRYDSCSNVMRRDIEAGRLPTVQVTSSIIAGIQTLEAVKIIQGQPWSEGCIIQYNASTARPDPDVLTIMRRPGCWCNQAQSIQTFVELPLSAIHNTLRELMEQLGQHGYTDVDIILPDQFVIVRICERCKQQEPMMRPRFTLDTTALTCSRCDAKGNEWVKLLSVGQTRLEEFAKVEQKERLREQMLDLLLADVGFPPLALVHFSFHNDYQLDVVAELTADAVDVMGGVEYATVRSHRQEF